MHLSQYEASYLGFPLLAYSWLASRGAREYSSTKYYYGWVLSLAGSGMLSHIRSGTKPDSSLRELGRARKQ